MPDGKITFATDLDNKALEKDLAKTSKKIEKTEQKIKKAQSERLPLAESADDAKKSLDEAKNKLEELKKKQEEVGTLSEEQLSDYKKYLSEMKSANRAQAVLTPKMADAEINADSKWQELSEAREKLKELQAQRDKYLKMQSDAVQNKEFADPQAFIDAAANQEELTQKINDQKKAVDGLKKEWDKALKQVEKYEEKFQNASSKAINAAWNVDAYQPAVDVASSIKEQESEIANLQKKFDSANCKVEKYGKEIEEATMDLARQKQYAGEISDKIYQTVKQERVLKGTVEGASKRFGEMAERISKLAASALVFSVITKGLSALRDWAGDVVTSNDEASAAIARLKGALLTMVQPLVDVIIPAFTTFVNLLTAIIGKIAAFLSALGGKTVKQSADAAKALNKQTNAINGVGDAAEKAQKQLMGFDEINKLESVDTESSSTGGTGEIQADFSWSEGIDETLDRIADDVLVIGAGLALWKVSENLPGVLGTIGTKLGLILIAIGSLSLAWDGLTDAWENGVGWGNLIEMILGVAGAGGALYAAFGPIASGVMFLVGGLAMLVTGFHDAMENGWNLQNTLLSIAGILATGLGISLLTGSWIPLLIAAIAGLLLAFTVATGHGEELIEGIKDVCGGFVDFITGIFSGDIEKALGGIEKMFNGLKTAVGAVFSGLLDTILSFLDWLDEKTGGKLHRTIEFAKSMIEAFFDGVKTWGSGAIDALKQIFSGLTEFLAGVFTQDWDKALQGLKNIAKGVINGIISLVNSMIRSAINGINRLFGLLSFSVDLPGGNSIDISLPQITKVPQIPYLAQGAVIPPNREFLAVLGDQKHGTNIEAPLSTIEEAVANVLARDNGSMSNQQNVELLQAILEAVLSIELDGETLSNAVHSYDRKKAVSTGGSY